MRVVKSYPNNVFCWVDLATPDIKGAQAFYNGLFGWEAQEEPIGDSGMTYTNFTIDGKRVAGGGQMGPEMIAGGMPPAWTSYVKNDDIDAVAARATAAGAQMMFPPMDIMEEGRMGTFADPTGAVVGLWQPNRHAGAQLVNQPNTLVWNELQTHDLDAARAFYSAVFGWTDQMDEREYVMCATDGRTQAGMFRIGQRPDAIPNWMVYFLVENTRAAVARTEELGGRLLYGPRPMGTDIEFAVLQDPQGATFAVIDWPAQFVDAPPGEVE